MRTRSRSAGFSRGSGTDRSYTAPRRSHTAMCPCAPAEEGPGKQRTVPPMTGSADHGCSAGGTRDRTGRYTSSVAAGALVILCLSALPGYAASAAAQPKDALTLVRQALAALEVTPPAVSVALQKTLYALFSRDTRGVDMARVQAAVQALGALDTAGAAADLIDALRPGGLAPAGVDVALLTPVQPRFAGTPAAYGLLLGAAALVAAGVLIGRR